MLNLCKGALYIVALSLGQVATSYAACQPPAPVPPPEPEYLRELETENAPIAADERPEMIPVSTVNRQTENAMQVIQPQEARPLPDIVNCCPLTSITLREAVAKVSRRNEPLPVPPNEAGDYFRSHGVQFAPSIVGAASLHQSQPVWFQPLYFEDPNLERCGTGHGIATEFVSAVRFFGRAPLIPYMIGSQDPHQCVQSQGDCPHCCHYGKPAYLPPLNVRGVAFEAVAIVGLVFLFP